MILIISPQYRSASIHTVSLLHVLLIPAYVDYTSKGDAAYGTLDSLSAFWPGLQVLAGDVENAIKSHMICKCFHSSPCFQKLTQNHFQDWNIWKVWSGLPEVWDLNFKTATSLQYPLRPGNSFLSRLFTRVLTSLAEFVESTWYLYRATKDSHYLDVGGMSSYILSYFTLTRRHRETS